MFSLHAFRANASRRCPVHPEGVGAYFPIMTGVVLYIIPLITRRLAKTKKELHTVCLFTIDLLPEFVVLISREIVRQRR